MSPAIASSPRRLPPALAALALVLLGGCATRGEVRDGGPLHVASPDWRDQVLYFVMTDRFDDGDPGNNDQGAGEYDPRDPARWSGGDLAGIGRRLDYIRGLGATAVWVTPPVANLWWDAKTGYGGYHGYWASDFSKVDPHYGGLGDYQRLSRQLHGRGMYLVQDIVLNHTGNYFGYDERRDPADPAAGYVRFAHPGGQVAPTQWPFSANDPRDPAQRAVGAYHWTPAIADYTDPVQERTWQMSGLDDLDSENPVVRRVLRASYGGWIRDAGVDAFRIDTAFYVPPEALEDFLFADDAAAPGVLAVARATGRERFHVFGEGFAIDKPGSDAQQVRIETLMRDPQGRDRLPGMLNFPLYGTLGDVFARGRPTADLGWRVRRMMQVHARPHLMPTFVDNHDVDRFLAGGDVAGLEQALLAIMALPGIPTIYYGTEQGFTKQRASMFAAGVDSGGRDHFDPQAPLYRFLQQAIALRRGHRVLSRGVPTILRETAAGPGVIAWRMDGEGGTAFVAFNTAMAPALLDGVDTGLPAGTSLDPWFALRAEAVAPRVDAEGRFTVVMPARSALVWGPAGAAAAPVATTARASIEELAGTAVQGDFEIRGDAHGADDWRLVVDGDVDAARPLAVAADGNWHATVDTSAMADPGVEHTLVAWSPRLGIASARRAFRVEREWKVLADVADPVGDDRGPRGSYRYPTDPGWGANRQLDLERVRLLGAQGSLAVEIRTHAVTTRWNPANGFDHVAFTVFIELPDGGPGARVMPLQDAALPEGMRWHYRLRAHGWSNALTAADGASATAEGRSATPAAAIEVDTAASTVRFVLPAKALGGRRSLAGVRVYVTSWDYDGGFRPITPEGGGHVFGGGRAGDPKVMDASAVIVIP
jgi:glycosidase